MEGGVAPDVGAFQNTGAAAEGVEAVADLEAVGPGFHEEEVVRGALRGSPVEEGRERAVGVGFELPGIVQAGAAQHGPGEGIRVAVQTDDPSFGGRGWRGVGFKASGGVPLPPVRGRLGGFWFGWF